MGVTITLPQTLEAALKDAAEERHSSIEEFAIEVLGNAVRTNVARSPEEIVAEIRDTPVAAVSTVDGSLAEALRSAPEDPDFDLETWRRKWSEVDTEVKALSRANDLAKGRR